MDEENRIVISPKQLRGLYILTAHKRWLLPIMDLILIKHDADQDFKIEVRIEDAEAETGERTIAWIDILGDVTQVDAEQVQQ